MASRYVSKIVLFRKLTCTESGLRSNYVIEYHNYSRLFP